MGTGGKSLVAVKQKHTKCRQVAGEWHARNGNQGLPVGKRQAGWHGLGVCRVAHGLAVTTQQACRDNRPEEGETPPHHVPLKDAHRGGAQLCKVSAAVDGAEVGDVAAGRGAWVGWSGAGVASGTGREQARCANRHHGVSAAEGAGEAARFGCGMLRRGLSRINWMCECPQRGARPHRDPRGAPPARAALIIALDGTSECVCSNWQSEMP